MSSGKIGIQLEDLIDAVLWKLKLKEPSDKIEGTWSQFANTEKHRELAPKICRALANVWEQVFAHRLDLNVATSHDIKFIEDCLWQYGRVETLVNRRYLTEKEKEKLEKILKPVIRDALSSKSDDTASIPESINRDSSLEQDAPVVPQWKYLPVPEEEPEPHEEYDKRQDTTPEKLKLIGARVRGKKHKHEGTNCDDWFEFKVSGDWTIIAVSDGAGSKKFSRVGARVSCATAVQHLAENLKDVKITARNEWSADTFRRNEENTLIESDLKAVEDALHQAMRSAWEAVKKAVDERAAQTKYYKSLGRDLNNKDVLATLLLAVHTTVKVKEQEYSLVFSCCVGDGMVAAIDFEGKKGGSRLLMKPDSGKYAGEVEFLTEKMITPDMLRGRTYSYVGRMRALLLMTDGVADDYFPNDPGMSRLYGDLVLNQIIDHRMPSETDVTAALEKTNLPNLEAVAKAEFFQSAERIISDKERLPVRIRSVQTYAEKLGLELAQVLASPELLLAGCQGQEIGDEQSPVDKLLTWLDSYYVRGSFDDRTLVALYRQDI